MARFNVMDMLRGAQESLRSLPDPGEKQYQQLRNIKLRQDVTDISGRERFDRTEQLNVIKTNLSYYYKSITNVNNSPAGRSHAKAMLTGYMQTIPEELRAGIGPMLAYSPISPQRQKADQFDSMYSAPGRPVTLEGNAIVNLPRSPENWAEWAKYEVESAEHGYRRAIAIHGVEKAKEFAKPPTFQQLDQDGRVLAYRSKATGQIQTFSFDRDVDPEMLAAAIEAGVSMRQMADDGFIPSKNWANGRFSTVNGRTYIVRVGLDIATGRIRIDKRDVGKAGGKGTIAKVNSAARDIADFVNIEADEEKAGDLWEWVERFNDIRKMEFTEAEMAKGEGEAALEWARFVSDFQREFGNTPVLQYAKKSKVWLNWGENEYYLKGGRMGIIPTATSGQLVKPDGTVFDGWVTSDGFWYNKSGSRLLPQLTGMEPDQRIDQELITPPEEAKIVTETAAKELSTASKKQKLKIGDVILGIGDAIAKAAKQAKLVDVKKAESLVSAMSKKYAKQEVPGVEFWRDMKKVGRELKLIDQFIADYLDEIFINIPRRMIDKFLDIEIGDK